MTLIADRITQAPMQEGIAHLPHDLPRATMLVISGGNSLFFCRNAAEEPWALPSTPYSDASVAFQGCRDLLGANNAHPSLPARQRIKVNILGAHTDAETGDKTALAETLYCSARPQYEAGQELSQWLNIPEGCSDVEALCSGKQGMRFRGGTARTIMSILPTLLHKEGMATKDAIAKMASMIYRYEVQF